MMADFTPFWTTPSQQILTVTENDVVDFQFSAYEKMTVMGVAGQYNVILGSSINKTLILKINGVVTSYTKNLDDQDIRFTALTGPAVIEIESQSPVQYSILNGELPPGLTMSNTGKITGTVWNITATAPLIYSFTVRIGNGVHVKDRFFTIQAIPKDYPAFFNPQTLPPMVYTTGIGISYRTIGTFERGTGITFTLDVLDIDYIFPPLKVVRKTGLPDLGDVFGGLPPGLALVGREIRGAIAPEAQQGRYIFEVRVLDTVAPTSETFMIEVTNNVGDDVEAAPVIEWQTPAGTLAALKEGDVSALAVVATTTADTPIIYTLAPGSAELPPGLTLDMTGQIRGILQYHGRDKLFSFRVRATSGVTIAEREFAIDVINRFASGAVAGLSLRMRVLEEHSLLQGYQYSIPQSALFRSDDPLFGMSSRAEVYLIGGLNAMISLPEAIQNDGSPVAPGSARSYHGPVKLTIGSHRKAVVRNTTGDVIYEVIYRPLYDPQTGAGGFQFGINTPVENKVLYPQAFVTTTYVFPVALRNMRYDLAKDLGFQVVDPVLKRTLGPGGPEPMPAWMTSMQIKDDPTSVLGYVPAVVIAYVKAGQGDSVLASIAKNDAFIIEPGRVYYFDKYYSSLETTIMGRPSQYVRVLG